ncbi:MAG: hypothetical protein EOP04_24675 [Proteobacteria bacterium]|nr:MAG: hypothetical protein EOP04_24675 [Pseudomonadota bacterium]
MAIRFSGYQSTGNKVGTSWVVSKDVALDKVKDVCLSVADDAYFPNAEINFDLTEILVSTDYTGDVNTATWKNVVYPERKGQSKVVSASSLAPKANGIMLKDLIGANATKVTVAFRYTSTVASSPWWGVADLTLTAVPAE